MPRIKTHPGEVLREEFMGPLDLSSNALSIKLGVSAPRVNDIVRGQRAVTPEMALRFARFFNTSPQFWLNLQSAYDLSRAEHEIGRKIESDISPQLDNTDPKGDRIELYKDKEDKKWYWRIQQSHNPQGYIARSRAGYATEKVARDRVHTFLAILDSRADIPIFVLD